MGFIFSSRLEEKIASVVYSVSETSDPDGVRLSVVSKHNTGGETSPKN